jgi:hypothetical protein
LNQCTFYLSGVAHTEVPPVDGSYLGPLFFLFLKSCGLLNLESMFSFLVHTLFALQGSTKRTYHSWHPKSGLSLPFPTSINVKPQKRDALFASPRQQSEIIDESESSLDWLQKRLGLHDEHSIALAKRIPEAHAVSVEEWLASALDWLQHRIGLSKNEELVELVRRQPTILNASGKLKLNDAGLRKLVEKHPLLLD